MTTRRQRSRRALAAQGSAEAASQATPAAVAEEVAIDPDVARFVTRERQQQAAQQELKRAKREARQKAEEHQRLVVAKDAAASEVKRLRSLSNVPDGDAAKADLAYRDALAALIASETGSAPAWASPILSDDEDTSLADASDDPERADGSEAPEEAG